MIVVSAAGGVLTVEVTTAGHGYRTGDVATLGRPNGQLRTSLGVVKITEATLRTARPGTRRVSGNRMRLGDLPASVDPDQLDAVVRTCRCVSCADGGAFPSTVTDTHTADSFKHGKLHVSCRRGPHCNYSIDTAPSTSEERGRLLPHHKPIVRMAVQA